MSRRRHQPGSSLRAIRTTTERLPEAAPFPEPEEELYAVTVNNKMYVIGGFGYMPFGNPPGLESWPVHLPFPFNDYYEVHTKFLPSAFYWYVAVIVIVIVHVIAVVLAHRHLQRRLADKSRELVSELPWLVVMVGYTMLSLWLLAQPLIKETAGTSGG